ncbi:MAG: ABC transporter substrate-binding protein [Reyranellaceae bacterium]
MALIAALAAGAGTAARANEPSGEIVFASSQLRQQFDPTAMVAMPDYLAFDPLYDGLLNLGPQGKFPALAKSWKISEDGKTIDFTLRENVKFHNGDPFTAEDVKFTYDTLTGPNSTHSYRKGFVDSLDRIEVVSPLVVRFHLKAPWPGFFSATRYGVQPIVPKAYYEKVGAKGFQEKPVGTGPYKLVETKAGEWNRFEANAGYWGQKPKVKTITQRLVKEQFTLYAMLEKGEADIVNGLTGALLERIKTNPKLKIVPSRYSGTSAIYFSKTKLPEAKDKNVRLALGMAMNRAEIASKMLNGICEPASSIFTPATFGHLSGLQQVPYDPAKAKELLAAAGIKPGREISLALHTESFGSLPNAPQVLEALAGNLEGVGFKVTREPYDTAAWLAMMRGGKQPTVFYGPSSSPDDGGELISGWYTKTSVWSSGNVDVPEYSEIFRDQLQAVDLKKREETLQRFARLESQNVESIPLFWCSTTFAVGPRVSKWEPPVGTPYNFNLPSIELAK